jgi:energy-coupling factor transporter ATP-binding protein EcfA2
METLEGFLAFPRFGSGGPSPPSPSRLGQRKVAGARRVCVAFFYGQIGQGEMPRHLIYTFAAMPHMPIQKVTIQNCGCVKNAEVNLTRLHALIGPNDSGKSTILRALRTATQFAVSEFTKNDRNEFLPFTPLVNESSNGAVIGLASDDEYRLMCEEGALFEAVLHGGATLPPGRHPRLWLGKSRLWDSSHAKQDPLRRLSKLKAQIAPATLVRFDPDALREAAPLLPESEGIRFADERGQGLAAVYDAILNRDREAFQGIEKRALELFPTMKGIGLSNLDGQRKAVMATLKDGTRIGAREMSEGLLYFLGFAALQSCGASLLLVEEPENGLHPSRIRDVMEILRKISETAQVVIATHSPLVINEMQPNEVTVVTRDDGGTRCMPIGKTPGFADRSKVYALGELWLSYANGKDEAPLLTGGARE